MNSLLDQRFGILDFETTGLSPEYGHRVCEVGIRVVEPIPDDPDQNFQDKDFFRVIDEFEQLVDPQREISDSAQDISGITPEMVRGQPTFDEIATKVARLLEPTVPVAHNAPFDLGFLRSELELSGHDVPAWQAADSCRLARREYQFPNNKLSTIARELNVPEPTHRAMEDVRALEGIWCRFLQDLLDDGLVGVEDLFKRQGGPVEPPEPDRPESIPAELARALSSQDSLTIQYKSANGRRSTRRISPLRVTHKNDRDYVLAYCHKADDQRTFRLDRLEIPDD